MRRTAALLAFLLVVALVLSAPMAEAKHKQHPDASCQVSPNRSFITNGESRIAQTFTAQRSGALTAAQVEIQKFDATAKGDYILQIGLVNSSSGVPDQQDNVLASAIIPDSKVPTGDSTITGRFRNPATVVSGTQYALILIRPSSSNLTWDANSTDACIGKAFHSPTQVSPFLESTDFDLIFATFVSA
jgi:hypothetical protein